MSDHDQRSAQERARRQRRRNDAIFAIAMMVFAILLAFVLIPAGVRVPAAVTHLPLSPRFFPYVLSAMIFAFAFAFLIMTYIGPPPLPEDAAPVEWRRRWPLRLGVLALVLVAFVQLPERWGMLPIAILAMLALLLVGGERRIWVLIGVGGVVPIAVYFLFTEAFQVPMPAGPLLERR
jgi:putative tricarboxylic transport membrane protein